MSARWSSVFYQTWIRACLAGAGGLGCPVLTYLAGAGVGHIGIVEHDKLEDSNLHRQFLYAPDGIGERTAAGIEYLGLSDEDILKCQYALKENQRKLDRIRILKEFTLCDE